MADRADDFIYNRRMTPWDPIAGIFYDTEVIVCEYINGGWETVLNYLNLDLDVDPEQHERLVVEPSEEDVAKLESRRQTAHFKIYVPLDYDPNDGDKGLYVRWDMPVGAARRDMYFQAYHDWALTDYWTVTGGFPESGPRHFERWS